MRQIKFRAWDNKNKVMLKMEEILDWDRLLNYPNEFPDIIIMQFTGLKDKNGKEIYEGDIIIDSLNPKYELVIESKKVENSDGWETNLSMGFDFEQLNRNDKMEVIGNIYENPELIK